MRLRHALLVLLSISLPLHAQTTVTAKRLPNRTLTELAERADAGPMVRDKRHDERKTASSVVPSVRTGRPLPRERGALRPAPRVTRTFEADSSAVLYPADAAGAVGPLHIVTSTNAGVTVHDRTGRKLVQLSQYQFWQGTEPGEYYYDPRIAYDAAADRWVAVAIHEARDLMIAVSATGDPPGRGSATG